MVVNVQVDNTSKLSYIVYLSNHILHYMYLDEVDTLDDVDTDDDVETELDVDTLETKRRPQINIFQKIVFSMSTAIFIRKKTLKLRGTSTFSSPSMVLTHRMISTHKIM